MYKRQGEKQKLTPMMQQYMAVKEQNPDAILFYRLGDFYEMFFEDAKAASRELELTLAVSYTHLGKGGWICPHTACFPPSENQAKIPAFAADP